MYFLTIIAQTAETDFDLWIKRAHPDITVIDRTVLDDHAVQWHIGQALEKSLMDSIRREFRVDILQRATDAPPIRLFIADMDSTIVSGETLDDMAAKAGIGDQIAAITDRAMRGELDFKQALKERVSMLAGQPESLITDTLAEMNLNPGAEELLRHLKSNGVYCVLISGGFTQFTGHVAARLGFDAHFGNELILSSRAERSEAEGSAQISPLPSVGRDDNLFLTGDVAEPILDKDFKLQKLQELQTEMGLTADQVMAIGDGANDLPMLMAAGMGIAYHGKPILREALLNRIDYTGLGSLRPVFD